jgi:hypothetical protein
MDGLLRYNAIQSALSPIRKQKGWKLPVGGFQGIASKIYQKTKTQPLKQVLNNMDLIVEDLPKYETPFIPSEIQEWTPFFNFDADAQSGNGIWDPDLVSDNLYIKSPQLFGDDDYLVDASLLSYEDHFKQFSDYCNANRNVWWVDSGNAPVFRFTEAVFDWNEQKWYTVIELGRDDAYGYEPGIGPTVKEGVPKLTETPEHEEEPLPAPGKPSEKELEIRKIEAETERAKASTAKLSELNKAVDRLDSQLDRGLITKAEYKTYLKRLYEL